MADSEKPDRSEQGEVDEPQELAAEDAVAGGEQPTEPRSHADAAAEGAAVGGSDGAEEPVAQSEEPIAEAPAAAAGDEDEVEIDETPRVKPEIPGMDLVPDIVLEGEDPLAREGEEDEVGYGDGDADEALPQPIASAAIDLAAGARYSATGKRKTSVARVILKPGTGAYEVNGRTLEVHFPRFTLQRQIRQALETVGLEEKMDVVAKLHGGGISAQAGALRHGISRALVDADPNLRSELKRRGFLTRDSRVKERKKAGLKKARKRPQFSKR
jgi:small subunit ribosomal protein S9